MNSDFTVLKKQIAKDLEDILETSELYAKKRKIIWIQRQAKG